MKIIVYGTSMNNVRDKMLSLAETYDDEEILNIRSSVMYPYVCLKNGDTIVGALSNDSARGHKWDRAYIEKDTEHNILHNVIFRSFTSFDGSKIEDSYEYY